MNCELHTVAARLGKTLTATRGQKVEQHPEPRSTVTSPALCVRPPEAGYPGKAPRSFGQVEGPYATHSPRTFPRDIPSGDGAASPAKANAAHSNSNSVSSPEQ